VKLVTLFILGAILEASAAFAQSAGGRETSDYNFEGHLDFRVQSQQPGNQCGWWTYYLYDVEADDYRLVETALCKEQFDSEQELVLTRVNGGMAGLIYTIRHFRWVGFELMPIFVETQNFDEERRLFVRTRVTNIDSLSGPSVSAEILTPSEVGASSEFLN
jgi:hypothetical protein